MDEGTVSQKKDIRVTVTDPLKILSAIIAGKLPIALITINETKLKQIIKVNGYDKLDGCVIEQIVTASIRGK